MANRAVFVFGTFILALLAIFLSFQALSNSSESPSSPPVWEYVEKSDQDKLVILTASNEIFFDRLVNLIGSVHYWEPKLRVVAYDLGLTPQQVKVIKRMCNTEYKRFEFEKYPQYMRQLRFYAWKAVIINETLRHHRMVLWQDAGQEFRAPIAEIKEFIHSDGYFFDESDINFNHFCPQVMYDALGLPEERKNFDKLGGLHGAVLGFRRGSRAYRKILQPTVNCSMDEACISPLGTDLSNYRYDQSLFSLFAHKYGPFIIRKDIKFNACTLGYCPEFDALRDSPDPDFQQPNQHLVLFSRRHFPVKPYVDKVCYKTAPQEEYAEDVRLFHEQQALLNKVIQVEQELMLSPPALSKPKDSTMKSLMQTNRQILISVPKWFTEEIYTKSRIGFGIPTSIKDKIDAPVGDDITIADTLTSAKEMGGRRLKYLELGVSVGKTFVQMAASMSSSTLATIELEDINPTLEKMFSDKQVVSTWRYYSPYWAPRMTNDSCVTYKSSLGGYTNQVIYVSGDVHDDTAWKTIKDHKFNIIFSDAVHDPPSIMKEMDFIIKFDMLDRDNFLIWYDDLGGELDQNSTMTKAFISNFFALQKKFPFLDQRVNLGVVVAGGWIGTNEFRHLNGIISSLNVPQLIEGLVAV